MTIYQTLLLRATAERNMPVPDVLTPAEIGEMMGVGPLAVISWSRYRGLVATVTKDRGRVYYSFKTSDWLAWAMANRPKIKTPEFRGPRACHVRQWGDGTPRDPASEILLLSKLASRSGISYGRLHRECKRGNLPSGVYGSHVVATVADFEWWRNKFAR